MDLERISSTQRKKEILEMISFWRRLRCFNYFFDEEQTIQPKRKIIENIELHLLDKLFEFSLSTAYGEDISDLLESRILDLFQAVLNTRQGLDLEISALFAQQKITHTSVFPLSQNYSLMIGRLEYPAIFAKKLDCHITQFVSCNFSKENIDMKTASFIKNQIRITDQFFEEMDQRITPFQQRLDDCFKYTRSIKFISLKLLYVNRFYDSPSISFQTLQQVRECYEKHLMFFRRKVQHVEGLLCCFDKLEFGINDSFYVFGVFLFKNEAHESISKMEAKIHQLWESTFNELTDFERSLLSTTGDGKTIPYCTRVDTQWSDFVAEGILKKGSTKYVKFIRTTLNYLANQQEIFSVIVVDQKLESGFHGYYPVPSDHLRIHVKPALTKKKRNPIRKPHSYSQKNYANLLKKMNLHKIVEQRLEEIQVCYDDFFSHLELAFPNRNDSGAFEWLIKMEIFIYLIDEWKQSLRQPPVLVITKRLTTDLDNIYRFFISTMDLNSIHKILKNLLHEYGCIFSPRIMVAYIALEEIKELKEKRMGFSGGIMMPDEEKYAFVEKIRSLLKHPLHQMSKFRKYFDSFGLLQLSRTTYIQHIQDGQKKDQTLGGWIERRHAQSKKDYRTYLEYWDEKNAHEGTQIFITFEVKCSNFIANFILIDHKFREAIDRLKKVGKPEIYAYLGQWRVIQNQPDQGNYKITILFSIDSHYVDYDEQSGNLGADFKKLFQQKLEMLFSKYNAEQTDKANCVVIHNIQSKVDRLNLVTLAKSQDSSIEILRSWFYEVSHSFQYFILSPIEAKKIIKGTRKHKRKSRI